MTKEALLEFMRQDTNLSQICVTRLWKYVLKGCHDLDAYSRYSDMDALKIYAQNCPGKKPFAGKDFFEALHTSQKIFIEARLQAEKQTAAERAEQARLDEIENQRNPKIRVRTLKAVAALCELSGMTDDDVVDWDRIILVAKAFNIDLDEDLRKTVR